MTVCYFCEVSRSPEWRKLEYLSVIRDRQIPSQRFHKRMQHEESFRIALPSFEKEANLIKVQCSTTIDEEILNALFDLARARGISHELDRLSAGENMNTTEDRAVSHVALRRIIRTRKENLGKAPQIAWFPELRDFCESIRNGSRLTYTRETFSHVVHIGIGGSEWGPRLLCDALQHDIHGLTPYFVSNTGGQSLVDVLNQVTLSRTLFVVCTKTFTTVEVLANALDALSALQNTNLGSSFPVPLRSQLLASHFVAVTSNMEKASAFGIPQNSVFLLDEGIGGRYSVWSAISLTAALCLGFHRFDQFLHGGFAMDEHIRQAPLRGNVPVLLSLLDVWYQNFLGASTHAVLPYHTRLRFLVPYLQQLEMESNGKRVCKCSHGSVVHTGPVLWGGVGTNAQHTFLQHVHQGTRLIPCDFIAVVNPIENSSETVRKRHQSLLNHCAAQVKALRIGTTDDHLPMYKQVVGAKPSNVIILGSLTPAALGALLALYEYKTFVSGVLWGINSFDQWGVNVGKSLATEIEDETNARTKNRWGKSHL